MKVFKYPVPRRVTKFSLMLQRDFKFLRIHFQREDLQMWCEVQPDNNLEQYFFEVFGTGQEIPPGSKYLATYDDGPFVFHLYQMFGV